MPCKMNLMNPVLNKYEQLSEDPKPCKRELTRTAPLAMIPAVLATMLWECIKLPYALITTPVYLATRSIRQVAKSNTVLPKVEKALYTPKELLSCLGKIVQLMEGLLYSLVALFNFKAAANFFKGAGLFDSKLDRQRAEQARAAQGITQATLATRETRITTLENELDAARQNMGALTTQIADLERDLEAAQRSAALVPGLRQEIERWRAKSGDAELTSGVAKRKAKEDEDTIKELNLQLHMAQTQANKVPELQTTVTALSSQLAAAQAAIQQMQQLQQLPSLRSVSEKKEAGSLDLSEIKEDDTEETVAKKMDNIVIGTFEKYCAEVEKSKQLNNKVIALESEVQRLQKLYDDVANTHTLDDFFSFSNLQAREFTNKNLNANQINKIDKKMRDLIDLISETNQKAELKAQKSSKSNENTPSTTPRSSRKNEKKEQKEKKERKEKDDIEETRSSNSKSPGLGTKIMGFLKKGTSNPNLLQSKSSTTLPISDSSSNLISPIPQPQSTTNLLSNLEENTSSPVPSLKRSRSGSLSDISRQLPAPILSPPSNPNLNNQTGTTQLDVAITTPVQEVSK